MICYVQICTFIDCAISTTCSSVSVFHTRFLKNLFFVFPVSKNWLSSRFCVENLNRHVGPAVASTGIQSKQSKSAKIDSEFWKWGRRGEGVEWKGGSSKNHLVSCIRLKLKFKQGFWLIFVVSWHSWSLFLYFFIYFCFLVIGNKKL